MFQLRRGVGRTARVSTRDVSRARPYATATRPTEAKSSQSSRPSETDEKISDRLGKGLIASSFIGLGALGWGAYTLYQHRNKPYDAVMSLYREWEAGRVQPSYLPIQGTDEIRLLVLEPGQGTDPIRCNLKHVSLSDGPKYEALSYVWGDPDTLGYIRCGERKVRIGEELFKALVSLREPDRQRVLWADALCINQTDGKEKGKQVQIMGDIYASSQHVLVWLGKVNRRTEGAFEALAEVDAYLKRTVAEYRQDSYAWVAKRHSNPPNLSPRELAKLYEFDWSSIFTLLKHRWPRRVWTLQEIKKAPRAIMILGRQSIPAWDFFRPLLYVMTALQNLEMVAHFSDSGASIEQIQSFSRAGFDSLIGYRETPLLGIVAANATFRGATNPRDRIYAFRSISNDHDWTDWEILPDYEASVEEVYSRFARWNMLRKKRLAYLGYAGLPDQHEVSRVGDFPSWVADWTRVLRVNQYHILAAMNEPYKAGSGLEPALFWIPNQPRLLHIKGRVVDAISELAVTRVDLLEYYARTMKAGGREYRLSEWQRMVAALVPDGKLVTMGLLDAQQAVAKYGTVKGPMHMLVDVVWMENCRAIASKGTDTVSPARFEAFWRTMIRNRTVMGLETPPVSFGETFQTYLHFLRRVRDGKECPPSLPGSVVARYEAMPPNRASQPQLSFLSTPAKSPKAAVDETELEIRRLMHKYWGGVLYKHFCSTAKGNLGWVPRRAEPGDLICVLDGASVPYVIRPRLEQGVHNKFSFAYWSRRLSGYLVPSQVAEKDPEYILVGECYVHGLMESEALARTDLKSQFFTFS
ncbi:HET-domain-containing protein [Aspergillus ellipticus CBS 707.79]|uniref:HET-domain-containing protein n=1 Tax=Aspergillus ellipticus CBS 707.79 TaxID=1448320 RepID=A0A319DM68_9EURO|nr:HET-domain-containing protein [Aspergillus ellipticus CBS 707.79]